TILCLLLDAPDPVAQLGAGVLGIVGVGQVAILGVIPLPQQEKPPAVLTPADQVASLQTLVEVQLQHGLEAVRLIVLVDFEGAGAGGGLPGNQVKPYIVHAGVESS